MKEQKKLYKVSLRGWSIPDSYVVAMNAEEAYQKVRTDLDKRDWGFSKDKELRSVELLASDYIYNDIEVILYL